MKKRIITFMFALLLSSGMLFANTTAIECYATAAGCVAGGVASIMERHQVLWVVCFSLVAEFFY